VWVLDLGSENATWSRWKVSGRSLKKIEYRGQLYLSIVTPSGLYIFDEQKSTDDSLVNEAGGYVPYSLPIRWFMETNTQGANRAHDAWSHLQQANLVVGNFEGQMRYGIRGKDRFGQPVTVVKRLESKHAPDPTNTQTWDLEDYLLIKKDLKEWFFFAESLEIDSVLQPSSGQLTLVQYRYAPISVNDGYEYGSVETFEYGAEFALGADATTTNGVPQPFIDTGRP
jgi:hypothetical protein